MLLALLLQQFPVGTAAPALISEHPSGLQHPWGLPRAGAHGARHPRCSGIHPSIHLFAQKQGVSVRAVPPGEEGSAGGGQGWDPPLPPARAITKTLFRCLQWPMLAGLSFPLGCRLCNARVHGRFSLARGPSLPSPTPSPGPGTAGGGGRGGHGRGLPFCLSPASRLLWHLGAPVGSAWTTVPKNPLEGATGSSLNEGFAGTEQEQPGARALLLPWVHISRPFQSWFVKPKQAQGQQSCRGFESPYK